MPRPAQHKRTKWKEYTLSNMEIHSPKENRSVNYWKTLCKDGTKLTCNFEIITVEVGKKSGFKYFIMDQYDFVRMQKESNKIRDSDERNEKVTRALMSMTMFSKFQKKTIYIRALPPAKTGSQGESRRVFTDEVLEVIPILLKQQNTPISEKDDRLESYRIKWRTVEDYKYNSMNISEFERVLEEFKRQCLGKSNIPCNTSAKLIVPDVVYELNSVLMLENGYYPITIYSPDGSIVVDTTQALLFIFQLLVCGVNWNSRSCEIHVDCVKNLKEKIITLMEIYANMSEGIYIEYDHLFTSIHQVKNECGMIYRPIAVDFLFAEPHPDTYTDLDQYIQLSRKFDLPVDDIFLSYKEKKLPVCMIRMFLIRGWMSSFFDQSTIHLKNLICDAALHKISKDMRDVKGSFPQTNLTNSNHGSLELMGSSANYALELLLQDACKKQEMEEAKKKKKEENVPILKAKMEKKKKKVIPDTTVNESNHTKTVPEEFKPSSSSEMKIEEKETYELNKLAVKPKEKSNQEKESIEMSRTKKTDITLNEIETSEESRKRKEAEPLEEKKAILKTNILDKESQTTPVNESKCCSKCLRTSEMCNEAKKELKSTQNKLKNFESKAKRTDELEKKLKENEKEMAKMKIQLQEMEKMKARLAENEATEAKLRKSNEEITESLGQFKEKVSQLEIQLKSKEQNNRDNELEKDISEKDKLIERLKETNMRVSVRNEEQSRCIHNLIDRWIKANSHRT